MPRLLSPYLCARSRFLPSQLGVGVKGVCEAIIHSVSRHFYSAPTDKCWTLLLDFWFFKLIQQRRQRTHVSRLSQAYPFAIPLDGSLLLLPAQPPDGKSLNPQLLWSPARGPSTPPGFCSHSPTNRRPHSIRSPRPIIGHASINAWYLDDGTLVGSPNDLMSALEIIEREGTNIGLHLNKLKSLLFIPPDVDESINPPSTLGHP